MGRPRKFDEERVVDAACRVFWRKGYEAASVDELCAETGLTRSSLFNAFISKEHLFKRALSHYLSSRSARQAEVLDTPGVPGAERIRRVLALVLEDEAANRGGEGEGGPGCFSVNTITVMAHLDPEVARLVEADLHRRLSSLRLALMDGRLDGSITSGREPGELAWYLNSVISGMRVSGQAGADSAALEAVAAAGMDALSG
ncbi:TetR/AcrR family transcriptional regulator [Nocardiopsis baichengensis]|uniref:TetR/AcrR family transcriptional regulator n=1 Tax=Nocardiopsis baichengensis TaxID=280240 RepID=UPI000344F726|nr:TetR/AcrR family transcriptional regulator [Nocardiopsis baichengensis]